MFRLFVFLFFVKPLARRRIEAPQITSWNIRPSGHNIGLHLLSTSGACLSYPSSHRCCVLLLWDEGKDMRKKMRTDPMFLLSQKTLDEGTSMGRCTTCRYLFFGFLLLGLEPRENQMKKRYERHVGGWSAFGRVFVSLGKLSQVSDTNTDQPQVSHRRTARTL